MIEIIENVLSEKLGCDLLIQWLNNESIEGAPEDCILFCCDRNAFVAHFISFLRNQTDGILHTNNATQLLNQTPDKLSKLKNHRLISDSGSDNEKADKSDRKIQESPNRERNKTGRRIKTKLLTEEKSNQSISLSDESRLIEGVERIAMSTPVKNGMRPDFMASPVTPTSKSFSERCDTPRMTRHSRSQDKSISLGDYLVMAQPRNAKKKRSSKNASTEDIESKVELDLSNSDIFPEIGARKSSSLRSERKRIKPTVIDKSVSLNNFTDALQQPSLGLEENIAFKTTPKPKDTPKNFDAERNILRQERHNLMEKFNVLNTNVIQKSMPKIKKIQQEETCTSFLFADVSKVHMKDKIDYLVRIYDGLMKNNVILSVNTEIYYLITIILSKQDEQEYLKINESVENILKTIHNSTYFAIKSLWNIRLVLEVILDKNALKTLGENKKIRSFLPDLAKFLLNSYGLKCEMESQRRPTPEVRKSNGIVCFNIDTDNVDNFPSLLSFQNFKKQRDMFYEILRWYQDTENGSRSSMRARIKSLLSCGPSSANHAHLAKLFIHMLAECLPPNEQESKLYKLQRRLTCPNTPESNRLPHFTEKEMFYK